MEGVRLRTGVVFSFGGAEAPAPIAACSVQPTEVMVGEPITATVTASNFNPKHTVTYSWSGNGGKVTGKDTTASIDTNDAAPGAYTVTAHVTDPKARKANEASCSANYTIKPLPPKNPPTMSLSASPTELTPGGAVNVSANCTSPDGVPVSVANWTSTLGTLSGSGNSATLNTSGLPARSGDDYRNLHGLAWIERAGYDAGDDSESSTATGRQGARSPSGAAQRLLPDCSAYGERSNRRTAAESAANADGSGDGLQEVP